MPVEIKLQIATLEHPMQNSGFLVYQTGFYQDIRYKNNVYDQHYCNKLNIPPVYH